MRKILLYFVLFYLNFCNVNAVTDPIQEEFEQCERLCQSVITSEQKEGYLRKSAWYLNRAIDLAQKPNTSNEEIMDELNDAAWNFVQARIKVVSLEEIGQYFSRRMPFTDGESRMIDFGAYLKNNNIGCCTEDIRNAMIACYFKKDGSWGCLIM